MQLDRSFALAVSLSFTALALAACDSPKGDLGEYSDTGTPDDVTGDATDGDTPPPDDSETAGDSGCGEPADESWESATFTFDPPLFDAELAGECQVTALDLAAAQIDLDCGERTAEVKLVLDDPLAPLFGVGDTLVIDYRSVLVFGESRWFTLRLPDADQTLVLAGVEAETLVPADAPAFFAPLTTAAIEGVCPAPITCDNMSEELALSFAFQGESVDLLPQHHGVLAGQLRISVELARKNYDEVSDGKGGFCSVTDVPPYFYSWLVRAQ